MGSVGDAYDNLMCESFFATLECELLNRRRFATVAGARRGRRRPSHRMRVSSQRTAPEPTHSTTEPSPHPAEFERARESVR